MLREHATFNRPVLGWFDRLFGREQYDAHQILINLADTCQHSLGPGELAHFVETQVDGALHPERIAVCVRAPLTNQLVASRGKARSLDTASPLVALLRERAATVDLRLDEPGAPLPHLPLEDQHWLADGGFRLLTPIIGSDNNVIGLIAVGDKRHSARYSQEDHLLLHALAVSAAPRLEMSLARSRSAERPRAVPSGEQASDSALECAACGLICGRATIACAVCGGRLVDAPIPAVLVGKFRVERRIGSGSIGVVYAAWDLELGRPVAIKTLLHLSSTQAFRLRQEARALGRVTHPHLITLFGAETWHGIPLLIFELLSGGTLAKKIESGPLPVAEMLDLGIALSSALERIHGVGMLHCDVKPSNIGFESWGTPKLLDFGLAQIVGSANGDAAPDQRVGTPAYLSPEAAAGQPPDVGTDLWQLSMVLYESVTGSNPLRRATPRTTLTAVRHEPVPPAGAAQPDCPQAITDLFLEILNRDSRLRPQTATSLGERLQQLKGTLAHQPRFSPA